MRSNLVCPVCLRAAAIRPRPDSRAKMQLLRRRKACLLRQVGGKGTIASRYDSASYQQLLRSRKTAYALRANHFLGQSMGVARAGIANVGDS